jgi:hypothetical protein
MNISQINDFFDSIGHFQPGRWALPVGRLPVRSESDQILRRRVMASSAKAINTERRKDRSSAAFSDSIDPKRQK